MRRVSRLLCAGAGTLVLVGTVWAAAQAPAPPPAAPSEPFSYNPEGRRDPFVSLLARGTDERPRASRIEAGLAGLAVDELSVRGVIQSASGPVAMVQGPEGKTFLVRVNDQLLDGVVRSITPQGLVIVQAVNDPLSLAKQREVRKYLRAYEEGKK